MQSATLDTLNEGVAVFGPDGRLKLHNAAFARIWDLKPEELQGEPHARAIAGLSAARFGDSAIWDRLIQAIVSDAQRRAQSGRSGTQRPRHSVLEPLAAAGWRDAGDLLQCHRPFPHRDGVARPQRRAGSADRLKSDFIKHVSYELRTPLSTPSWALPSIWRRGVPGGLNGRQQEYVQAIVSGSNTLKDLVNDILDLALVESGALRLELERSTFTDCSPMSPIMPANGRPRRG